VTKHGVLASVGSPAAVIGKCTAMIGQRPATSGKCAAMTGECAAMTGKCASVGTRRGASSAHASSAEMTATASTTMAAATTRSTAGVSAAAGGGGGGTCRSSRGGAACGKNRCRGKQRGGKNKKLGWHGGLPVRYGRTSFTRVRFAGQTHLSLFLQGFGAFRRRLFNNSTTSG
jgi:hypothetical protein